MADDDEPIDYLTISMSLLNHARTQGFYFRQAAPRPDAALVGTRFRHGWTEVVRIDGWRSNCQAWKQPGKLVLAIPSENASEHVSGSALHVLNRVVCW